MRRRDPVDRLRDANPLPLDDAPVPDSAEARALFERIVHRTPEVPRANRWFGRRLWVLLPVAALIGAATYGYVREVTQPIVLVCYQQPQIDAHRAVVPVSDDAVGACRALWHRGSEFNGEGNTSAPLLTECILDSGARAIFPQPAGTDTCEALGLARPAEGGSRQRENEMIVGVLNTLSKRFVTSCVDREQAVALARAELLRHGLDGWRVITPIPFTGGEPCASVSFDVPGRSLRIIPVTNSPSP
jgi:hypothetical protein